MLKPQNLPLYVEKESSRRSNFYRIQKQTPERNPAISASPSTPFFGGKATVTRDSAKTRVLHGFTRRVLTYRNLQSSPQPVQLTRQSPGHVLCHLLLFSSVKTTVRAAVWRHHLYFPPILLKLNHSIISTFIKCIFLAPFRLTYLCGCYFIKILYFHIVDSYIRF